ncbi:MAG: hypothetical protein HN742_12900 [Lentisphaerae bacterium]|jgi:hypothetical protein|nr:hypothetical protein [Lentisphaerota bacterium]MBT4821475.1 hypothetical protein [Lentisphaerota bacterium]MBT5608902.1 hypothetical protein [Lentisphaerota bacterium]MBT7057386.1 hypothetical protein [Lentisphaerota bacterium]MBT7842768.1 hypothetical protein [Lentisphaerota bacterium]
MTRCVCTFSFLLASGLMAGIPTSYIRLEEPTATTFPSTVAWSILSEKWAMSLRPLPGGGPQVAAEAEYTFTVPGEGGEYALWMRSYDHRWSSPATWQVDGGPPRTVAPLEVTGTAVEAGCFRMDWQRLGTVSIPTGEHRLRVDVSGKRPQNDYPYFVLDVILLVRGGGYTPTGPGCPDLDVDRRAGATREAVHASALADKAALLDRIVEIRRRCLEETLAAMADLDRLGEELSAAIGREMLFREPLVARLHGAVDEAEIRDGKLQVVSQWNRSFSSDIWVGWAQQGALYAGDVLEAPDPNRLTCPIPANLPAGDLIVHLVPIGRAVMAHPTVSVRVPPTLATDRARASAWGIYRDGLDLLHPWQVSSGGMLLWEGKPYYPVGGMVNSGITWQTRGGEADDTPLIRNALRLAKRQFETLADYGLKDIFFNGCFVRVNPNAFNRLLRLAEDHGMRYGIHVSSMPELTSMGFHRGADYVVDVPAGVHEARITVEVDAKRIRGRHRCLWALVDGEGEPVGSSVGTMHVSGGNAEDETRLTMRIAFRQPTGEGMRVVFLPELPMSRREPSGYYAGIDHYIRRVHETYGQLALGPNLRLWLDPFQNEMHATFTSVCSDPRFQAEYRAFLSATYAGNAVLLNESWQPVGEGDRVGTFEVASRLIPIQRSASGYAMVDSETGRLHRFRVGTGDCVRDLAEFRGRVCERFITRMADELKRIANVPVVLKHNLWFSDWFVNPRAAGGLDGVGFESYCYGDSLAFHNSLVTYSEALNAGRHQWSLVTETSPAAFDGQKDYVGYIDRLQLLHDMDLLTYYGAKGFYTFGFSFLPGPFKVTELLRDTRQLEWLCSHGKILSAASERLVRYRPEVYGWYPVYLHEQEVLGEPPPAYAMDGHYTGVPTQIRQAPDRRWIVPALRPDADWHGLLVPESLVTARQAEGLRRTPPTCPVSWLGTLSGGGRRALLDGSTAHGVGVIDPETPCPTLDEFRRDVLGYRVFQTRDLNGHTLPDGRLRLWTCVEKTHAELVLPGRGEAWNLAGDTIAGTGRPDGTQCVPLVRPEYRQHTEDRPDYLTHGYFHPDSGQPEMVVVSGAGVEDILKLNAPVRDRWLPEGVDPTDILCWQEAENPAKTTFTQPRLEGYSRYSGGTAIGINTHFAPSARRAFTADYTLETPACDDAVLWLRRMLFPASAISIELDGRTVATFALGDEMTDLLHLNPWSAGLGVANLQVGWSRAEIGDLRAGPHMLRLVVDPRSLKTLTEVDTRLMGADAAKRVGGLKHGRSLRCIQVDAIMLTRLPSPERGRMHPGRGHRMAPPPTSR